MRAFSFIPGLLTKGEHSELANWLGGDLASPTTTQFARSWRQQKNSRVCPNFVILLLHLPRALLCAVSEDQLATLVVPFCFSENFDFGFIFVRWAYWSCHLRRWGLSLTHRPAILARLDRGGIGWIQVYIPGLKYSCFLYRANMYAVSERKYITTAVLWFQACAFLFPKPIAKITKDS